MEGRYNTRSPAVKRLMKEAQELSEPTDQYYAQPLEDNLFEWHFTVRGPVDTEFQLGVYHGRIVLPPDYPMKPPSIIWLTPNGRFETNKKICLSISGHHPESWQPSWSIRTALLAIIGFMPTHGGGAIGSLDYTPEERKSLAKKSRDWKCPSCGDVQSILLDRSDSPASGTSEEVKKLAAQINFQGEKPKDTCSSDCLPQQNTPASAAPVDPKRSTSTTSATSNPTAAAPTFAAAGASLPSGFGHFQPWMHPPADLDSEWDDDTSEDNQITQTSDGNHQPLVVSSEKLKGSSFDAISNLFGTSALYRIQNCSSMPELKILTKRIIPRSLNFRKSEPAAIYSASDMQLHSETNTGQLIEAYAGDTRHNRRINNRTRRNRMHGRNHTGSYISVCFVIVLTLAFMSMGLALVVNYILEKK